MLTSQVQLLAEPASVGVHDAHHSVNLVWGEFLVVCSHLGASTIVAGHARLPLHFCLDQSAPFACQQLDFAIRDNKGFAFIKKDLHLLLCNLFFVGFRELLFKLQIWFKRQLLSIVLHLDCKNIQTHISFSIYILAGLVHFFISLFVDMNIFFHIFWWL